MLVHTVCGGLLMRDAAMIAVGVPHRLLRGPALLLWLETAAAAAAVLTGQRPVMNADALDRAAGQGHPDRWEAARRATVAALFGLHPYRFRI